MLNTTFRELLLYVLNITKITRLFQYNNAIPSGKITVILLKGTNGNVPTGNKHKHIYYSHSSKTNKLPGVQAVIITQSIRQKHNLFPYSINIKTSG